MSASSRPVRWSAAPTGWMTFAISSRPRRAICSLAAGCCLSMAGSRPRRYATCWNSAASLPCSPGRISVGINGSVEGNGMDDQQLLRYSRQILLPQIDVDGQQRLLDSRVLIVGMGGLGGPAALYLAGAGVGTLLLADDDQVDLTNLQRQIIHGTADLDRPKTASASERLAALNPTVELRELQQRLVGEQMLAAVGEVDLVLDCTDNFTTRQALNRACVALRRPLVSGAAIGLQGQISVFDFRR